MGSKQCEMSDSVCLCVCTVDGEGGAGLRLPHHVLRLTGVSTGVSWSQSLQFERVVLPNLMPEMTTIHIQTHMQEVLTPKNRKHISFYPSYLPLGRSPSSFLQRMVGTGSPWASHLNSTLWSTRTDWLLGFRKKLGLSAHKHTVYYVMQEVSLSSLWDITFSDLTGFLWTCSKLYPSIFTHSRLYSS